MGRRGREPQNGIKRRQTHQDDHHEKGDKRDTKNALWTDAERWENGGAGNRRDKDIRAHGHTHYDGGALERTGTAERIKSPEHLTNNCSPHVPKSSPRRCRQAPQLSNTCRNVVQKLSNKCSGSRDSALIRPNSADVVQHVPLLANLEQIFRNATNFDQIWPSLARIGQCRPQLVDVGHIFFGRIWPKSAKIWRTSASLN